MAFLYSQYIHVLVLPILNTGVAYSNTGVAYSDTGVAYSNTGVSYS